MQIAMIGLDPDMIELIESRGDKYAGYFAPEPQGPGYLGPDEEIEKTDYHLVFGLANPKVRAKIAPQFQDRLVGMLSPDARIAKAARIARTAIIQTGSVVTGGIISDYCYLHVGAQMHHDCHVGKFTILAPRSLLLGSVTVGQQTYIGANASVRQHVTIGSGVTVGMGSVVTKDVPDNATVYGVPAREH